MGFGQSLFGAQLERAVERVWGAASVALLALLLPAGVIAWKRVNGLAEPAKVGPT